MESELLLEKERVAGFQGGHFPCYVAHPYPLGPCTAPIEVFAHKVTLSLFCFEF